MTLGIMQPYFFPYLGYFHLMNRADRWIVFDTAQYIRHGWVNRNRILHPTKGWQYVSVPVRKHARETPIADIRTADDRPWRRQVPAQLEHYRRTAPHYEATVALVREVLEEGTDSLARINVAGLAAVARRLGIDVELEIFSAMDVELGPIAGPADWALRISEAVGATRYVNPPGADFFDPAAFSASGIEFRQLSLPPLRYDCPGYQFEENLSVIDVLMWNEPSTIKAHLDAHGLD